MSRLWLCLACLALGCAPVLSAAVSELEAGRPDEADLLFRALEPEHATFSAQERAHYALYRGLTHLALGNAHEADRWLRRVKASAERQPSLLSDAEYGRLLCAWRSMGRMPGE